MLPEEIIERLKRKKQVILATELKSEDEVTQLLEGLDKYFPDVQWPVRTTPSEAPASKKYMRFIVAKPTLKLPMCIFWSEGKGRLTNWEILSQTELITTVGELCQALGSGRDKQATKGGKKPGPHRCPICGGTGVMGFLKFYHDDPDARCRK